MLNKNIKIKYTTRYNVIINIEASCTIMKMTVKTSPMEISSKFMVYSLTRTLA
jgi:hypothetical protein